MIIPFTPHLSPEETARIFKGAFSKQQATTLWDFAVFLQASAEKKGLIDVSRYTRQLDYYEFADHYILPFQKHTRKLMEFNFRQYESDTHSLSSLKEEAMFDWWWKRSPFSKNYAALISRYEFRLKDDSPANAKTNTLCHGLIQGLKEAKKEIVASPNLRLVEERYPQFNDRCMTRLGDTISDQLVDNRRVGQSRRIA